MDLLHLAIARELRVPAFLTFDNKQQALAKLLGFETSFA
jgi:predicted nucleic acid-binding protein